LAAELLLTLALPLIILIDGNRARISDELARGTWLTIVAAAAFWLLLLTLMRAAVRAAYLMHITCGSETCSYRLPHVDLWEFIVRPFALCTGELSYSMIAGVEKRREAIRWGQACFAVRLIVAGQPPSTFVRAGVGDHQWVEAFARDIAARAQVSLVDRGLVRSMFAPWH
jgi:hypothetical protein